MDTRITDKIRKLLTLAGNNPSAEEAAAAFARAQDLATRHRIELASLEIQADDPDAEMIRETIATDTKRLPGWRSILLGGVFHSSGVFVVLHRDGRYTLAGRRGDIDTAKYLYAAIGNEIERLARENAQGRGRAYANAYRVSAASTVCRRLRQQHEQTMQSARSAGANESAIVLVNGAKDAAESWYIEQTGAKLGRARSVQISSRAGSAAGRRDGERINIGGNTAIGKGRLALGAG